MGKQSKVYEPKPETIERMKAKIKAENMRKMQGSGNEPIKPLRVERIFRCHAETPFVRGD